MRLYKYFRTLIVLVPLIDVAETAFVLPPPLGLRKCNRLPFGLYVKPPGLFNEPWSLGDLNQKLCVVYLDDIIIFYKTIDELKERMRRVLETLKM